jgi:hypothetical protein
MRLEALTANKVDKIHWPVSGVNCFELKRLYARKDFIKNKPILPPTDAL